jgi:hypothetical protein
MDIITCQNITSKLILNANNNNNTILKKYEHTGKIKTVCAVPQAIFRGCSWLNDNSGIFIGIPPENRHKKSTCFYSGAR